MTSLTGHPAFPPPVEAAVELFPDMDRARALTDALQSLAVAIFPEATLPGPVIVNFGANRDPLEYVATLWHSDLMAENDAILRVRGASLEEAASLLYAALLEEACTNGQLSLDSLGPALVAARGVVRPLGLRARFEALSPSHSEETTR